MDGQRRGGGRPYNSGSGRVPPGPPHHAPPPPPPKSLNQEPIDREKVPPPFPPAPYMCVFFNLYDFLSDVMIRTGFIQSDYCIFVLKISSLGFISAVYTLLFCFQAYVFFIHCWLLNLCYYHNW